MSGHGFADHQVDRLVEAGVQVDMDALLAQAEPSEDVRALLSQGLLGPLLGHRNGVKKGSGLDFSELNHYQLGDDIRHIDWRLSNRKQTPFVRQYQEEKEQRFELVIDQRPSMLFGSLGESKATVAAKLGAQLGWQAIHQGDPCACSLLSSQILPRGQASRSLPSWLRCLNSMAECNQQISANDCSEKKLLLDCVEGYLQCRSRGRQIFLISDFADLDEPTTERSILQSLSFLAQHNSVRMLFIFDDLERSFPDAGFLPISDGVHHAEVNSSDQSLQDSLSQLFQSRVRSLLSLAANSENIEFLAFDGFMHFRGDIS